MHKTNSKCITVIVIIIIVIIIWNYPNNNDQTNDFYQNYQTNDFYQNYQFYQNDDILKESSHIPKRWLISTDPINWYKPEKSDYYGPDGPIVYAENLHSNTTPDHDPLMN